MNKLLSRLEARYGRYAIPGLTLYLVAAMGVVFVLEMSLPGAGQRLTLDVGAILQGEVWRLLTWVLLPPSTSIIWILFSLMMYHMIGTQLEAHWGAFRYQVYLLFGFLFTLAGAALTGAPATNSYLLLSLFLAFATLWPDFQFLIFFILPVRVKWLAWLSALGLLFDFITSPGWTKILPVLTVGNYLLFFWRDLLELSRRGVGRASRQRALGEFQRKAAEGRAKDRACAKCGASVNDRDVELRVCFCDKHGGQPTDFCMAHIRDH